MRTNAANSACHQVIISSGSRFTVHFFTGFLQKFQPGLTAKRSARSSFPVEILINYLEHRLHIEISAKKLIDSIYIGLGIL